VTPFDPFSISVGKHELQVTLVDTPGYGEFVNTEASFEVIGRYVEVQLTPTTSRPLALTPALSIPQPLTFTAAPTCPITRSSSSSTCTQSKRSPGVSPTGSCTTTA
jgi:hypothetical protein